METKHGTVTGYTKHKCRCDECVEAWRKYKREYQKRPHVKAKANARIKERRANDPIFAEKIRAILRKSAAKRRKTPEGIAANRANGLKRMHARREWLQGIKMERGCTDCGYKGHPDALEFDHIGTDKRFSIKRSHMYPKSVVAAELEKCEVVCANCHRIRTYNRRELKRQT